MFSDAQRSKNILARVRALTGQNDDTQETNDNIYALATAKMIDIAESVMCVEAHMTIPVISGTAEYDLKLDGSGNPTGFFRKKLLAPPFTQRSWIKELDPAEWDFQRRYGRTSTGLPVWYIKIFEGVLTFFPTPAATDNWTMHFYKSPTTTISKTVGPETPSSFDAAICASVASQMMAARGDEKKMVALNTLYDNELARGIGSWRARKTQTMVIIHEDI